MLRYENLVRGLKNHEDAEAYFLQFFTDKNYKEYETEYSLNKDQKKAIKTMFTSKKEILKRADAALNIEPLCIEAFFVYFILTEDIFVNYRFKNYFNQINEYGDLDEYDKYCFIKIMDLYVEFLLDLHNFSGAIKVQKMINRLTNNVSRVGVSRLAMMYSILEDSDEFYRLYLDSELDGHDYLLLLITLLKNDEELKAKEVLKDMFENIEYSSYIDHLWDLDLNDPKQKEYYDIVEENFDDLSSVPDFFAWVNLAKEDNEE